MGWLWTSSKPNETPQQAPPAPFADSATSPPLSPPSTSFAEPPDPPSSSPSDPTEAPKSPDSPQKKKYEYADAEFRAFFRELAAEEAASLPHNQLFHNSPLKKLFRGSSNASSPPSTTTQSLDIDNNNKNNNLLTDIDEPPSPTPNDLKITPTNIFPTSISCRSAFDQAFYCQSLGGQFNAVYHYGGIRNCGHLWSQFWFCVRTNRRAMSEEDRKRRVMEWYQTRERKYQEEPSSEDVWVQRETMLVGAFERDYDELLAAREEMKKLKWREERGLGWAGLMGREAGGGGGGDDAVLTALATAQDEEEKGRAMWKERIKSSRTEEQKERQS